MRGGGCGCNLRGQGAQTGGFYPSVMDGLTSTGPYFVTAAFMQGARLIRNDRARQGARLRTLRQGRSRSRGLVRSATKRTTKHVKKTRRLRR